MKHVWIRTTIGEQVTLQRGIDITKAEQNPGNVPVISSGGISSYHDTAAVSGPGVILGRKGVVGSVYYIESDYWPHDTTLWVKDFHGNYPRFVYYFFKYLTPLITTMDVGSANPTLNRNHVHPIQILWPPLPTQRAIAHILGTLDDKIELNRKMNETLEAMAQAIFKSWFVDFDPVRAKMEGVEPAGMDAETAALFPGEFEIVDGREVPKGWRVVDLGDISDIIDCLHAKKPTRQEVGKPYLQLCNIRNDGLLDMTDVFYITPEEYLTWISRIEAKKGDCLITNAGRVGAVCQIPDKVNAALGRNMTAIRLKKQYHYPTFLIECLLSSAMRQEIEMKIDRGTVLDSLNVRNIPKLRLVFPLKNLKILEKFEQLCRPLRKTMEKNFDQSNRLAQIRDTLLPKLISGELNLVIENSR